MEKKKLQVVVRVRPKKTDENAWVRVASDKSIRTVNHRNLDETLEFDFEHVFGPDSTQEQVYSHCVRPLMSRVMEGQNASVFAYGPTGSGKTFTMLGEQKFPGIIPRVVSDLLIDIKKLEESLAAHGTPKWLYHVSYSYLEVYNEKIQDLLDPKATDCVIREDRHHNILIGGLSEKNFSTVEEFNASFIPASRNRTTAATLLNPHSSRSHSLLLLKVTKKLMSADSTVRNILTGKLYLIDLAGSEDNRRTGNKGIRLKESGAINTSLFMLSEVVEALNKQRTVIPYRQSKLTRLLQDSLGGSADSCMIVNISPEEQHYLDTMSTLKLARSSKKIVNTITVHEENIAPPVNALSRLNGPVSQSTKEKKTELCKTGDLQPFISPLIRRQKSFEQKFEKDFDEMKNRVENQLSRLKTQRKSQFEPDSAVSDEPMAEVLKVARDKVMNMKATNSVTIASRVSVGDASLNSLLDSPMVLPVCGKRAKSRCMSSHVDEENLDDLLDSPFVLPPKRVKDRHCSVASSQGGDQCDSFKVPQTPHIDREHSRAILNILNTGSVKEIQKLYSIGAKKAGLIFEYRQRNGPFSEINDLVTVPGFSLATLRNFRKMNFI